MTYLRIGIAVATIGLLVLVNCAEEPPIITQTDEVNAFAKTVLHDLQAASITQGREYCGYIFETENGDLAATPALRGGESFCDLPEPDANVLASYHTHGGFSEDYDNEVPSIDDMSSDFGAGIDGYISTPGGRIWLVDYSAKIARQLCSEICVTSDPSNDPEDSALVPLTFTLEQLEARFE